MPPVRIFISSPGDVELERQIARRVIARLQGELGDDPPLEAYFWEYEPMRLTRDFQSQIPRTSSFDIVVCILWSRLGSPLGPQYRRPDGTAYRSGTEFEFEDAARSYAERGVPDILVYRNRTDPPIKARPREERERQLAQFDALEAFLDRWTRDSDVFKGALTTYADLAQFEERLTEHLRKLIRARAAPDDRAREPERPRATWTAGSPFRGLEPFELEHEPVFRGRTREVQDVIELLRQQRLAHQSWSDDPADRPAPPIFALVSAMSGIGKSSLVRAGVLPLLITPGVVEGVGLWRRAVLVPTGGGGDLFDALAAALTAPEALPELLADGTPVGRLARLLRDNPGGLDLLVKGALSQAAAKLLAEEQAQLGTWEAEFAALGRPADAERCRRQRIELRQREAGLAFLVDQLEEVFTASEAGPRTDRERFLSALDTLARGGRAMVLATLRSDFLARASEVPALAALIREGALYQLEPPSVPELAQIIREPAREAGLTFEEDPESGARLDDVLLAAVQGDPAALPLLEFTLDQLYQRRGVGGCLLHRAYRELNGVEGALAKRAEEEFAALGPEARGAFGPLFGALVNLADVRGEERPVRRRAALAELAVRPGARELVDRFARARLLVLDQGDGQAGVAVVHEALFSHWDRLKTWIDEHRALLRVRARVEAEAARWDAEGRPRDLLLPAGRLLAEARELVARADELPLGGPVAAFVGQSARHQTARRRQRYAAVALLAAGLAVALVVSWFQVQTLNRNRLEAKQLEYRQAVRRAENMFLTQLPTPEGRQQALEASLRVFQLADEVRALQGTPLDTADVDAVNVLEYTAILRAETGDAEGSLRDIEARKALLERSPELGSGSLLAPSLSPYTMVVLDLQMELFLANEHLKALLLQNEVLQQVLAERMARASGSPTPTPSAAPGDRRAEARATLAGLQHFEQLYQYLAREYPRERVFDHLIVIQDIVARRLEALGQPDEARRTWENRIGTARRMLEWARQEDLPSEDKERVGLKAARAILQAQQDLGEFHRKQNDFGQALTVARQRLETAEAEPELEGAETDRFAARRAVAAALAALGQREEAVREVETGAASAIQTYRAQLANRYEQVADAREAVGNYAGAVEAAQQAVALLEGPGAGPASPDAASLHDAYLNLSWHQLLNRQFAEAAATADEDLRLPLSPEQRASGTANLAHALLFRGQVEQAESLYEAWKDKPVDAYIDQKAQIRKRFAQAVVGDFAAFERIGLTHPAMPTILASMNAAMQR